MVNQNIGSQTIYRVWYRGGPKVLEQIKDSRQKCVTYFVKSADTQFFRVCVETKACVPFTGYFLVNVYFVQGFVAHPVFTVAKNAS